MSMCGLGNFAYFGFLKGSALARSIWVQARRFPSSSSTSINGNTQNVDLLKNSVGGCNALERGLS